MSLEVNVKIPGLAEMVGRLDAFRNDQLPYALSLAMNRAAKDAKDRFRPHMARVFDLRSTSLHRGIGPFGRFGGGKSNVRVNEKGKVLGRNSDQRASSATKDGWSHRTQWPNLRVVFGSESHGLARQESGGTKPNTAPSVWIPTRNVLYTSPTKKLARHTPSKLRRKLETLNEKTGKAKKQSGQQRVFIRNRTVYEREQGTNKALPLYLIRDRAEVPARMGLERLILDTYHEKLWPRFSQAMRSAMASARNNRFTK